MLQASYTEASTQIKTQMVALPGKVNEEGRDSICHYFLKGI
jgi:hypothetical protein